MLTSSSPAVGQPYHRHTSDCSKRLRGILSTLGSWRSFLTKKTYPKHLQQSEQREERGRRLMGEEGEGWWLEGWGDVVVVLGCGGAEMWGRQAAEVRLRCKSDEDFWKAKSQRERCCLGLLHYKQPELRRAGLFHWRCSMREKKNNYNDNLCMLHLTNVADGKYFQCKKVQEYFICKVSVLLFGAFSWCKCYLGFSISWRGAQWRLYVVCMAFFPFLFFFFFKSTISTNFPPLSWCGWGWRITFSLKKKISFAIRGCFHITPHITAFNNIIFVDNFLVEGGRREPTNANSRVYD